MGSPPSTPTWTSAAEESECSGRATSEIADTTAGHDEREGRAEKIVMAIEREMNENTQETHNSIDVGSDHLAVQVHGVVHEGRGNKPISKIDFDQTGDTECGDVREVSRATRLHDANPAGLGGMPPRPACDVCTGPFTTLFGNDTDACGACIGVSSRPRSWLASCLFHVCALLGEGTVSVSVSNQNGGSQSVDILPRIKLSAGAIRPSRKGEQSGG